MRENVSYQYPEDLFDNLIWLHKHTVTATPDIFASRGVFDLIELADKHHYIFHFPNGYGASVIKGPGTYGYEKDLWELAVLKEESPDEWDLCYDTAITADVEGYLSVEEVKSLLEKIKGLEVTERYETIAKNGIH